MQITVRNYPCRANSGCGPIVRRPAAAAGRGHALRGLYLWNRKPDWQAGLLWWVAHPFLLRTWDQCRIMFSANCGTWRVLPEGMSQMSRLLYLGNGWADCVEIWHALGDPLVTAYATVRWGISTRTHVQRYPYTALLYLGNGLTDCVQFGMWVGGH